MDGGDESRRHPERGQSYEGQPQSGYQQGGQPQQRPPGGGQQQPPQGGQQQPPQGGHQHRGPPQGGGPGRGQPTYGGSGGTSNSDSLLRGGLAGVAAFVAGYVLLYLLKGSEWVSSFKSQLGRGAATQGGSLAQIQEAGLVFPEQWKVVGMAFHGLHYVDFSLSATRNGQELGSTTMPGLYYAQDTLPWLVPPLVLLGAGFVLASQWGGAGPKEGAFTGAAVVAGYLPLVLLTSFLFTWTGEVSQGGISASITTSPALVSTIMFAGVLYPLAFGGLGGAAASLLHTEQSQPRARNPRR